MLPDDPSGRPLTDGAVIPSDRVETNVELSRILANLFPLLRSVRPADLNATLNALATALGGRGEQLGETMDELDGYLAEISDHLPTLREDLVELADVADTYDLAAPDLLDVLRDVTTTSQTVSTTRSSSACSSPTSRAWPTPRPGCCATTSANLIRVGEVTEPVLRLLAVYSPQLPCLLKGAARYAPRLARTFEGNEVKQYVEIGTAAVLRLRRGRPADVRRGRPRPVVPGPAEPAGPDPADRARPGQRHRREPARPRWCPDYARAEPARRRLHRHRGGAADRQRPARRRAPARPPTATARSAR